MNDGGQSSRQIGATSVQKFNDWVAEREPNRTAVTIHRSLDALSKH